MSLEEIVELDSSAALSAIDDIGSALTNSVIPFNDAIQEALAGAASTQIELNTDTGKLTDDIDSAISSASSPVETTVDEGVITDGIDSAISAANTDITPAVDIDEASITDQIDAAGANADIVVTPEVDTSGIDQLSSSADNATGSVEGLSGATHGLGVAGDLASGSMGALGGAASSVGGAAVPLAAGLTSILGVSTDLFHKALDLNEAEFRFNTILGDQANAVNNIHLDGLNTNIHDLAIQVGGSAANLKNASANIFQMGTSAGYAGPQVANTTQTIVALAARAVALNPALGDVGDVTNRLSVALARGGRFANQFGLGFLNSKDIIKEATAETGKSAGQLLLYEKAAAGAVIANQKLGTSLAGDIARGSSSATVSFKSLKASLEENLAEFGKPLISVFIQGMKELSPAIKSAAKDFADLAKVILPLAIEVLPLLTSALKAVDVPIKFVGSAIKDVKQTYDDLPASIKNTGKSVIDVINPFTDSAKATKNLHGALGFVSRGALDVLNPIAGVRDAVHTLGGGTKSLTEITTDNILALEKQGLSAGIIKARFGEQAVAAANASKSVSELTDAQKAHAKAAKEDAEATKAIATEELSQEDKLRQQATTIQGVIDTQAGALSPLNSIFQTLGSNAQDVFNTFASGIPTQQDYKRIMDETGLTLEQLGPIQQAITAEVSAGSSAAASSVDALGTALGDLKKKPAESIKSFVADYKKHVKEMADFNNNIAKLIQEGAGALANALIQAGPEAGAKAAAGASKLSAKQLQDLNSQYAAVDALNKDNQDKARQNYIDSEKAYYLHNQAMGSKGTTAVQQQKAINSQIIEDEKTKWQLAFANASTEKDKEVARTHLFTLQLQTVLSTGKPGISGVISGIEDLFHLNLENPTNIGSQFLAGLVKGLKDTGQFKQLQGAVSNIAGAVTSLKQSLHINSPSKIAQEIGMGWNEGLVLGLSDTRLVGDASKNLANTVIDNSGMLTPVIGASTIGSLGANGTLGGGSSITIAPGAVQLSIAGNVDPSTMPSMQKMIDDAFGKLFVSLQSNRS